MLLTNGARLQQELSDTHHVFVGHKTIFSSGKLVFFLLEWTSCRMGIVACETHTIGYKQLHFQCNAHVL